MSTIPTLVLDLVGSFWYSGSLGVVPGKFGRDPFFHAFYQSMLARFDEFDALLASFSH